MPYSIPVHICLPVPAELYADLFLKSEQAGVDFDIYVRLFFGIRALGILK